MNIVQELLQELRALRHEIKLLLRRKRRRKLCVGILVHQESVMSNPASLVTGKPAQAAAAVSGSTDPGSVVTTYSSDNEPVLTIDASSGAITSLSPGSATVTASATDSTGAIGSGTCPCTVTQAAPGVLTVEVDVTQ